MENIYNIITKIYTLIICLISSIVLMIVLAFIFFNINNIFFFKYKNKNELYRFETNENYIKYLKNKTGKLTIKQIKQKRIKARTKFINNIYYKAFCNMINCIPWAIVGILFFTIHLIVFKKN